MSYVDDVLNGTYKTKGDNSYVDSVINGTYKNQLIPIKRGNIIQEVRSRIPYSPEQLQAYKNTIDQYYKTQMNNVNNEYNKNNPQSVQLPISNIKDDANKIKFSNVKVTDGSLKDETEYSFTGKKLGLDDNGKVEKGVWKRPQAFDDGYQVGDVLKTVGSTVGHGSVKFLEGVSSIGEGVGDLLKAQYAQHLENEGDIDNAKRLRKNIARDQNAELFDDISIGTGLKDISVLGKGAEDTLKSTGYSTGMMAFELVPGGQAAGTAIMFANATGQSLQDSYQNENVTSEQAWTRAIISGALETAVEKASGLLGVKGSWDKALANKLSSQVTNGFEKMLIRMGVQGLAESAEEFESYVGNFLLDKLVDKIGGENGAKLSKDWNWEELGQQMGIAFASTCLMGMGESTAEVSQIVNNEKLNLKDAINEAGLRSDIKEQAESLNDDIEELRKELRKDPSNVELQNELKSKYAQMNALVTKNEFLQDTKPKDEVQMRLQEAQDIIDNVNSQQNQAISQQNTQEQQITNHNNKVAENGLSEQTNATNKYSLSESVRNKISKISKWAIDKAGNLKSFKQQINDLQNNNLPEGVVLVVSQNSKGLEFANINPDDAMIINQRNTKKITTGKHNNISNEIIENIDEKLKDSVFAMDSRKNPNSKVFVLNEVDDNGNPIIVSINENKTIGKIEVNEITSVYEKTELQEMINRTVKEGKKIYTNEKTDDWLLQSRFQLPTRFTTPSVSINNSIPQNNTNMQVPYLKNAKTMQDVGLLVENKQKQNPAPYSVNYDVESDNTTNSMAFPIEEGKQRKHYKTISNSDQVTKETRQMARKLYNTETYTPISNVKTISQANENIRNNGVERTYESFMNKMGTNERVTLQDIATGERLIQIYSQSGDYAKVNDLIQTVAILGTELGQQVQALSLIRRASPEGQLAYLQKVVERTNIKEGTDIKVTNDMAEKILNSANETELQENVSKVAIEIANEIPLKLSDKLRSWRYLSMLGNPRTHIRNLAANVAMNVTQNVKNKVAGAGEDVVGLFKDFERTKTLKPANQDQKVFAKQDAKAMQDLIDGGGKFDIQNIIQSSKRQFDNRFLNWVANFNTNALDFEDKIFLKKAYQQAMQNYMAANNLSSTDMEGKTLQKAREYASLQAQEATFHQFNSVANAISNFENKNTVTKVATSAIMPFKKTPMNIAKTGFEYSPLNIARSVGGTIYDITKTTNDLKTQLENGNITQEQYHTATSQIITNRIDQMAKGLTGTSIAILGYMLAAQGIIKAGNDDKDDEFEEKLGKQTYSIQIGDNTYTLDWMSPTAIPLFTGVTAYQMTHSNNEEDNGINAYVTSIAKTLEPMTEMSMLQGLANAISSYESGSNMFFDLGASMGQSYLGQYIPTALGQVTKTIDPNIRDTSSTKKGFEKKVEQFVNQTKAKIPGLSYTLPTKTDVWGNDKVREGNIVQRYFNNAIAPYNKEKIKTDKVSDELVKVYNNTGEASVLPTTVNKDLTINKEKYTMTSEEFAKYKKQYGQTSYDLLNKLTSSSSYKNLNSEQKQNAIDNIYKYAKEQVKVDYAKEHNLDYEASNMYNVVSKLNGNGQKDYFDYTALIKDMDKQKEKVEVLADASYSNNTKQIIYENSLGKDDSLYNVMKDTGIDITEYLKYKTQDFESDKTDDGTVKGKTVSGSKKTKVYDYVNNMKITGNQRLLILGTQYNLTNDQKSQLAKYVYNLKISKSEKLEIYKKLKGFTVYKDGKVTW